MRMIIVEREGLSYVEVSTKETKLEKIEKFATKAGKFIDKVLFSSDISHLPVPKKEMH